MVNLILLELFMYSCTNNITDLKEYAEKFPDISDQLHEGQQLPLVYNGENFFLERVGNSYVMMLPLISSLEFLPQVIEVAQLCCEKANATTVNFLTENQVVFQALILKEKLMLVAIRKNPCLDDIEILDWARSLVSQTTL